MRLRWRIPERLRSGRGIVRDPDSGPARISGPSRRLGCRTAARALPSSASGWPGRPARDCFSCGRRRGRAVRQGTTTGLTARNPPDRGVPVRSWDAVADPERRRSPGLPGHGGERAGPFDQIVLALPAPLERALAVAPVVMDPCWAAMRPRRVKAEPLAQAASWPGSDTVRRVRISFSMLRRCARSEASHKEIAIPPWPARAVRPIRCT